MKRAFTSPKVPRLAGALLALAILLSACGEPTPFYPTTRVVTVTPTAGDTPVPPTAAVPSATLSPTAQMYDPNVPESWVYLPVLPETVSQRVRDLYEKGKTSGLNQEAFSKVGDCETYSPYFLAPFDLKETGYRLGTYSSLESAISVYVGSFERASEAADPGASVAWALSPLWADPAVCRSGETPLICEIRLHKPAIALVMFGTNDVNTSSREGFEANLRRLLDLAIANNVVPVLVTKADNLEGDGSVNAIIARVAHEYDIPLLNMWRAMQTLPSGGLMDDGIHLTYAQPYFDLPENMQMGWPVRNLVTLQMLEFLRSELE
jgi:hypothetical protein